jgi:hypothetical protein
VSFDHDFWRRDIPGVWRERGLHWHCFTWQGPRPRDAERRDTRASVPPIVIRQWLEKPVTMMSATARTPEEAARWLDTQPQPSAPGDAVRRALYELRVGNDVVWGFWSSSQAFVCVAVVSVGPAETRAAAQCGAHGGDLGG